MNTTLYNKYGCYNDDNYFIENHNKWDYYAQKDHLYRRNKRKAFMCILIIPIFGFVIAALIFDDMGLSLI
jgi:hypothetical protein